MPENFEREVLDRLIKIEAKLESWDNSKNQIYNNQREIIHLQEQVGQLNNDVNDLQDRNKWLSRTTTGAIITTVISIVVAAVFAVMQMGG